MPAGRIMLVQKAKSYALPRRKKNPKTKPTKGVTPAVKKFVNRTLNKAIENKYDYQNTTVDISNVLGSVNPYFNNLNCSVAQAAPGQGGRIGNRITVKNAILKGSMNMRDYSSLTNSRQLDQMVTIVVFKLRSYLVGTNPTNANFFSRMFQLGSSATGLLNLPIDHIRRYNKDLMQVKAVRHFKLGFSQPTANFGATGTTGNIAPNNDFSYQRFFSIPLTKFYKKTQIFDDDNGAAGARNDNLFFMVFTAPVDGSAFTSTPISLTWDWELTYEDA